MKKKRIILIIITVVVLVAIVFGWNIIGPSVSTSSGEFFYVKTGADYKDVEHDLKSKKFLSTTTWFKWVSRSLGYSTIKPGRYKVHKGMSVLSLVRMLKNGQQTPVSFVITKIRTREVLASRIGRSFECDSAAMYAFLSSNDSLRSFGLDTNTVMAVAMPLTYSLKWNTTPRRLLQQFDASWKTFWTDERKQKADSLHLTPFEVSTVASIVDEETNAPSDRPNIASVYINRVNRGMPLQADPTLKFALKDFAIRRVTSAYMKVESPYNTYLNKGLPPGPICTPQQATLEAVLNSPKTDYLYFVANSARDGTHIFTTNYKDHMKYARLFQQELNRLNIH